MTDGKTTAPGKTASVRVGAPDVPAIDSLYEDSRLYCFMRSDLASLNSGKAVAQGMHGANGIMEMMMTVLLDLRDGGDQYRVYEPAIAAFSEWRHSAGKRRDHHPEMNQGFGATIVKAVTERQMRAIIDAGRRMGVPCGIVFDPSYPLVDGDSFHEIPLDTCAFMFVGSAVGSVLLRQFDLMP